MSTQSEQLAVALEQLVLHFDEGCGLYLDGVPIARGQITNPDCGRPGLVAASSAGVSDQDMDRNVKRDNVTSSHVTYVLRKPSQCDTETLLPGSFLTPVRVAPVASTAAGADTGKSISSNAKNTSIARMGATTKSEKSAGGAALFYPFPSLLSPVDVLVRLETLSTREGDASPPTNIQSIDKIKIYIAVEKPRMKGVEMVPLLSVDSISDDNYLPESSSTSTSSSTATRAEQILSYYDDENGVVVSTNVEYNIIIVDPRRDETATTVCTLDPRSGKVISHSRVNNDGEQDDTPMAVV